MKEIDGQPFSIILPRNGFDTKEEIFRITEMSKGIYVNKVYKMNWWKRLLLKLGFSIKLFKGTLIE